MSRLAYVDTSAIVAVAFGEKGSAGVRKALAGLDTAYSSNLLEAELRAAANREGLEPGAVETALSAIRWVYPHRPLSQEFRSILEVGYLRGADLWHVACAKYLSDVLQPIPILTLDARQREVAEAAGILLYG